MQKRIKLLIAMTAFLVFGLQTASAQIFQTKNYIIENYGDDYTSYIAFDNTNYFTYEDEFETEASGTFTQTLVLYFAELDDKTEICYMFKIFTPETEIESLKRYISDKLVQIDTAEWKDYDNKILYQISTHSGLSVLTVVYDEN